MKFQWEEISPGEVLIVDDEVDAALLMKVFFLREGCTVHIEATLEAALTRCKFIAPDTIMLDGKYEKDSDVVIPLLLKAAPATKLIVCRQNIITSGDHN